MTEIQTRLMKNGGPAVIFENVINEKGEKSDMPVMVNLFGTKERVALGMDRKVDELRELGETLAFLRQPEPPAGIKDAVSMLPLVKKMMSMKPKTVSSKNAPVHDVVLTGDDIDLDKLPIQGCWPDEPAPLITWPLVVTQGPNPQGDKEDQFNLGIYRMQKLGKKQNNHALVKTSWWCATSSTLEK